MAEDNQNDIVQAVVRLLGERGLLKQEPDGTLVIRQLPQGYEPIASGLLTASETTIFTARSKYRDVQMFVSNVDTVDRTATVHWRVNGASAADSNCLFKAMNVTVNNPVYYDRLGLNSGDIVSGSASSANTICVYLFGIKA